jgi:hypothetical protein
MEYSSSQHEKMAKPAQMILAKGYKGINEQKSG